MNELAHTSRSILPYLSILVLTVLVGYCDAQGLAFASKSWRNGTFIPQVALVSLCYFLVAIFTHIYSIKMMQELGIASSVLQSLIWLASVSVVVTIVTGGAVDWSWRERIVAANALVSIGWLISQVDS